MSTEKELPIVNYEQLEALEDEFEEIELEMIRKQFTLTKDLYTRRQEFISSIPSFWPLVIEQSPPEIDEYIQPSDAALFMNSLHNISVDRPELPNGDPRSFSVKFEFSENEYFEDKVVEKVFKWRNAKDGWAGLVSEPVTIKWKEGKDLTQGMLDLVRKVYDEEVKSKSKEETPNKKKLKEQMEATGLDGLSFFAFFGFHGPIVSDEEHAEATKKVETQKQLRKEGKPSEDDDEMEEDEDEEDDMFEWEIFPTGDDLGVQFADELWPNAIRYFMQAQENELEGLSDVDFEDDDDEDEEMEGTEQPTKKRKA